MINMRDIFNHHTAMKPDLSLCVDHAIKRNHKKNHMSFFNMYFLTTLNHRCLMETSLFDIKIPAYPCITHLNIKKSFHSAVPPLVLNKSKNAKQKKEVVFYIITELSAFEHSYLGCHKFFCTNENLNREYK